MVLKAHSDVSYLSVPLARSRSGDFSYMGGTNKYNNPQNGAIVVILTIMCNIIISAAEAECGALLYNTKELESIRKTLR